MYLYCVLCGTFFRNKNTSLAFPEYLVPQKLFLCLHYIFISCHGNSLCCSTLTSGWSCASIMALRLRFCVLSTDEQRYGLALAWDSAASIVGKRSIFHVQTSANLCSGSPPCLWLFCGPQCVLCSELLNVILIVNGSFQAIPPSRPTPPAKTLSLELSPEGFIIFQLRY